MLFESEALSNTKLDNKIIALFTQILTVVVGNTAKYLVLECQYTVLRNVNILCFVSTDHKNSETQIQITLYAVYKRQQEPDAVSSVWMALTC